MRQAYTPMQQPNGRQGAAMEPLKSRSQVATHEIPIDGLDDDTLAALEAVRAHYELPDLDAAAQMMIAQRLRQRAGGKP